MSEASVLLLSMRQLSTLVAYCSLYEFEDLLQSVVDTDRLDPSCPRAIERYRRTYKYARLLSGSTPFAARIAPKAARPNWQRHYDLFVASFNHPHELAALAAVPGWRQHCRVAVCFIVELWLPTLPRYLLELLNEFDHVFVSSSNAAQAVERACGRPCTYLPLGVDTLRFVPPTSSTARTIAVSNLGRRSPITHGALLSYARRRSDFFYYYDSVAASGIDLKQRTFSVDDHTEHRELLASLLRRSRFYLANRARVNEPALTIGGDEISTRFYEGAASGAVMIGEAPISEEFERQFDWTDAIIRIPFDSPEIADLLLGLERDADRVADARRRNIRNALLRHDWLYRIESIFRTLGMVPTSRMSNRARQLQLLAESFPIVHDKQEVQSQAFPRTAAVLSVAGSARQ